MKKSNAQIDKTHDNMLAVMLVVKRKSFSIKSMPSLRTAAPGLRIHNG